MNCYLFDVKTKNIYFYPASKFIKEFKNTDGIKSYYTDNINTVQSQTIGINLIYGDYFKFKAFIDFNAITTKKELLLKINSLLNNNSIHSSVTINPLANIPFIIKTRFTSIFNNNIKSGIHFGDINFKNKKWFDKKEYKKEIFKQRFSIENNKINSLKKQKSKNKLNSFFQIPFYLKSKNIIYFKKNDDKNIRFYHLFLPSDFNIEDDPFNILNEIISENKLLSDIGIIFKYDKKGNKILSIGNYNQNCFIYNLKNSNTKLNFVNNNKKIIKKIDSFKVPSLINLNSFNSYSLITKVEDYSIFIQESRLIDPNKIKKPLIIIFNLLVVILLSIAIYFLFIYKPLIKYKTIVQITYPVLKLYDVKTIITNQIDNVLNTNLNLKSPFIIISSSCINKSSNIIDSNKGFVYCSISTFNLESNYQGNYFKFCNLPVSNGQCIYSIFKKRITNSDKYFNTRNNIEKYNNITGYNFNKDSDKKYINKKGELNHNILNYPNWVNVAINNKRITPTIIVSFRLEDYFGKNKIKFLKMLENKNLKFRSFEIRNCKKDYKNYFKNILEIPFCKAFLILQIPNKNKAFITTSSHKEIIP